MVGGGLLGRNHLLVDDVLHGREQASLVAHELCHFIEQRGGSSLAVGAGDAHQFQFLGGAVEPFRGEFGKRDLRVGYLHKGYALWLFVGQVLAHNGCCTLGNHIGNKAVGIDCNTLDGDEQCALARFARVACDAADSHLLVTHNFQGVDGLY